MKAEALEDCAAELHEATRGTESLAANLATLSATGLCFHGPDGTDYDFTAAGIAAAARDVGENSSLPPRASEGRREAAVAKTAAQNAFDDLPCSAEAHRAIVEALERARVVGVLDAWAEKTAGTVQLDCEAVPAFFNKRVKRPAHRIGWSCWLSDSTGKIRCHRRGETPDAARAAAAKAIEEGAVR